MGIRNPTHPRTLSKRRATRRIKKETAVPISATIAPVRPVRSESLLFLTWCVIFHIMPERIHADLPPAELITHKDQILRNESCPSRKRPPSLSRRWAATHTLDTLGDTNHHGSVRSSEPNIESVSVSPYPALEESCVPSSERIVAKRGDRGVNDDRRRRDASAFAYQSRVSARA